MIQIKSDVYYFTHKVLGRVIDQLLSAELYFYDKFMKTMDEAVKNDRGGDETH